MLIALDARTVYAPTRRGTGKNLLDLYTKLADLRPDWQVTALHRQPGRMPVVLPGRTVRPRRIELVGDRFDAWERFRLPIAAWRSGADLLHCPANTCPTWSPVPTVVTIHDLIPLDLPDETSPAFVKRLTQSVRSACRRVAQKTGWIICPSRYTRDQLVDRFDVDPDRITVNPWAADTSLLNGARSVDQRILKLYNIDSGYVLHFGAASPRKNTRRLLEGWSLLDRSSRARAKLVIVGLNASSKAQLMLVCERLGITSSVLLHCFADEEHLPALMRGALALAYPSLAEGFGLPILDAWATDTPVLTSNCSCLPEVAGDAAILVDPTDPCAISRSLRRLIREPSLRVHLIGLGRERLKQYTWEATTQRFAEAMEQAAEQSEVRRAAA